MAGSAIEVKGVTRRFKVGSEEVFAVRDISLSVQSGEFLALIGRSGSGKTTLLNVMAGLDRPTSGEIWIDGERVDTMSEGQLDKLRRHKLGFIFQSFGLLPLLSARENVELPLRIAGVGYSDRMAKVKRALDFVGLGRRADHRPYELSGGEQQRVAIARALASEPSLILADEPTGELDSATATAVFSLLRELARAEGITIVTCTHDRLVMEMASRVEELADGRLVTGQHREVWDRIQQRERSPFSAAPAAGIEDQPALSSLIGADLSQFKPASERVTHVAADPHQEEGVEDHSPAHVFLEKRAAGSQEPAAAAQPVEAPEPAPAPEVEDGSQWARPRD
ncbi:MAG: ABC transporter ATP-binding protein [Dehalococcoidia bacterium]|uniref:ABC transporter ATP-binding protein n=1 Tax=Candidatus Amarobacter glycogenicus TaxID=3140699 RepID=UPI00313745F9|nr:ABC transporter ATP-binding protein [Dehalococcoidia bacterium]